MIRSSLFFALLAGCLPFALSAAPKASSSIPFQVYLWPGTSAPTIQYSPNGSASRTTDIQATAGRPSPLYRYYGDNPLAFFQSDSLSDNPSHRQLLGSVQVPSGMPRALLLFLPNPLDSKQFRIYPIDNSLALTKPGQASVYNMTGTPVACLLGEQKMLLQPGERNTVTLNIGKTTSLPARVAVERKNGEWKQRCAQQITASADESLTVLIYAKPDKPDVPRILTIENPRNPEQAGMDAESQS